MPIEIRQAVTDADYEAWRQVRLAVLPNEPAQPVEWMRLQDLPVRLLLVASRGLPAELSGWSPSRGLTNAGRSQVEAQLVERRRVGDCISR